MSEDRCWTEVEIRRAMTNHHMTTGDQGERHGLCSCRYYRRDPAVAWTFDHFIEMLKAGT